MQDDPAIDLSIYELFLSERGLTWELARDGSLFYENLGSTFALIPGGTDARRLRMAMPWMRVWDDFRTGIPRSLSAEVSRRCPGTVLSVRHAWLRAEVEVSLEHPAQLGAVFGRCTARLVEARGIVRTLLGPAPGDLPWNPADFPPSREQD